MAAELNEQAISAAERIGSDLDPYVAALIANTRAAIAMARGAWDEAAEHFETEAEIDRSADRFANLAGDLSSAAIAHTMAGDLDSAIPLASEGVTLARRVGLPTYVTRNVAVLAGALAERDPHQARALLRESLELQHALGYEDQNALTQLALVAARLGEWPDASQLAAGSIRHLHWTGDWPQLAGIINVAARAIAPTDPIAAAVLQGSARRLAMTAIAIGEPVVGDPAGQAGRASDAAPGSTSFITYLRRETTAMLQRALGEAPLRQLRSEGEAMDNDHAVAYALDAIERARRKDVDPEG
jgi:tetratricopeptide (TPR) repeat protein